MSKRGTAYLLRFVLILTGLLAVKSNSAQISGSLFMNTNNFYSQIHNPSYFRTDDVVAFSVAGFAGFSFVNQGNFEIADVITLNDASKPVIDLNHFNENTKANNLIRQDVTIPVLYLGVPLKKGYLHFYYNENASAISAIREEAIAFLSNGNLPEGYRNFSSEEIRLSAVGYREFAFGYGKPLNDFLNVGFRGKLLFGAAHIDTKNWEYGLETSADGDSVALMSAGKGQFMVPFQINLNPDNTIHSMDTEDGLKKYLGAYQNPGFAIDLGLSYTKNDKHFFSAALRDLGAIWFKNKAYEMAQDDKYVFVGFDLVGTIRYPEENDYGNPSDSVRAIKDIISDIYEPLFIGTSYLSWMPVKTVLHYHYRHSQRHTFGATSQMAFQRRNVRSVLTLSAQQSWLNFSVFENVNIQGISGVTLGGGVQYEADYAHFFLAADNIPAIYHPAANKTFSLNFGVCFLLNHRNEEKKESIKQGRGSTSPYLPFYKELRNKIR